MNTWHEKTLTQLKDFLHNFESIQAVSVVGSLAQDQVQPDYWSDIDLLVVVSDQAIDQFYPGTDWLTPIHPVYTTSHSQDPPLYTLRVCFSDMRRIDFIFLLASAFENHNFSNLYHHKKSHDVLFSRSLEIEKVLKKENRARPVEPDPNIQFIDMSNDFWFKGILAVYKVVRNDLLIATHLALDLMRDCLVLRMMLRDRRQGSKHHRIGGVGNEFIDQMNTQPAEYSSNGILKIIENYSQFYDSLAKEWSSDYEAKREPLVKWIEQARYYISRQENLLNEPK